MQKYDQIRLSAQFECRTMIADTTQCQARATCGFKTSLFLVRGVLCTQHLDRRCAGMQNTSQIAIVGSILKTLNRVSITIRDLLSSGFTVLGKCVQASAFNQVLPCACVQVSKSKCVQSSAALCVCPSVQEQVRPIKCRPVRVSEHYQTWCGRRVRSQGCFAA